VFTPGTPGVPSPGTGGPIADVIDEATYAASATTKAWIECLSSHAKGEPTTGWREYVQTVSKVWFDVAKAIQCVPGMGGSGWCTGPLTSGKFTRTINLKGKPKHPKHLVATAFVDGEGDVLDPSWFTITVKAGTTSVVTVEVCIPDDSPVPAGRYEGAIVDGSDVLDRRVTIHVR
jgi:hypothetical protein